MKRSNRLVLLVGVFLAIVAFVGILVLTRQPEKTENDRHDRPRRRRHGRHPALDADRQDQVTTKTVNLDARLPGAFTDVSQVVGQIARQQVATGGQITSPP